MIASVQSAGNAKFRRWRKLLTRRGRRRENGYLVESRKLVAEWLASGRNPEALLFEAPRGETLLPEIAAYGARFADIAWKERLARVPMFALPRELFAQLSSMEESDGVIGVGLGRLAQDAGFCPEEMRRILVLDHIQDPGNFGALLRSAEAFGFSTIFAVECVDLENAKVLRGSMGAAFRLDVRQGDWSRCRAFLPEDAALVGADMSGLDYRMIDWPYRMALVVGNEGQGLRREIRECVSHYVTIPMQGKTESLNAAVSASILMSAAQVGREDLCCHS
ncbi:MAG: RNA methyltransferase [Ndongobacter sp.]|nr:RNA methyltransferase [Ndongobacter sp.]